MKWVKPHHWAEHGMRSSYTTSTGDIKHFKCADTLAKIDKVDKHQLPSVHFIISCGTWSSRCNAIFVLPGVHSYSCELQVHSTFCIFFYHLQYITLTLMNSSANPWLFHSHSEHTCVRSENKTEQYIQNIGRSCGHGMSLEMRTCM